jgi:hypothetical protein
MELYRGTLIRYLANNYEGELISGENGSHPHLYFSDSPKLATEYGIKMAKNAKKPQVHPVVIEVAAPEKLVYDTHNSSEEYHRRAEKAHEGKTQIFIRQDVGDKFTVPHLYTKYVRNLVMLDMDAETVEQAFKSGGEIVIDGNQQKLERIFRNLLS